MARAFGPNSMAFFSPPPLFSAATESHRKIEKSKNLNFRSRQIQAGMYDACDIRVENIESKVIFLEYLQGEHSQCP